MSDEAQRTRVTRHQWWLLAALMLLLAVPQAMLTALRTSMNVDGGFYTDIAQHVRDGHGIVTDVSLYHAGFPSFPHATPIYPLWPLLFGFAGRVVDILLVAHWLPFGFYVLSLVGAYLLGRRLFGQGLHQGRLFPKAPGPLALLNGGHVLAVMLGVQREYSQFTTYPYTEGMAFTLLLFGLWGVLYLRPRLGPMLAFGAWMALLCLTRSQLLIAPMAAGMALVAMGLTGREGRRWLLPGAAGLGVVGAALGVWWLHSRTFIPDASPLMLLRFDQAQVTHTLSPLDVIKDSDGVLNVLWDRLQGVALAWNPLRWSRSYARGFFTLHWALPIAAIAAIPVLRRLDKARLRAWLTDPRLFAWSFLVLLALGGLATIHLPHKKGFGTWYFHRRHAAIALLAFVPCLMFLLRHKARWARGFGIAILVSTFTLGVGSLTSRVVNAWEPSVDQKDEDLVTWLQARVAADGQLVVALQATQPAELAWRTDDIGYHWFYERTSVEDLRRMFDELDTTLLIYRAKQTRKWQFRKAPEDLEALFVPVEDPPKGWLIYRRRAP
jgi:hypothetical protein